MKSEKATKHLHDPIWAEALTLYLRRQLRLRNMRYQDLSRLLYEKLEVEQTEANLKTKIGRGNFGAQLFMMCLTVLEIKTLDLSEIDELIKEIRSRD